MTAPPCPQAQNFGVISGFITPGSDSPPPHPLDASITVDVIDPDENERVRILETTDRFHVIVEWCMCGNFAKSICGCWEVNVYMDDIDGVSPTSGRLFGPKRVDVASVPFTTTGPDKGKRCYKVTFERPANTVGVGPGGTGVYNLVAVVTLLDSCQSSGKPIGDWLGFAAIPVLAFTSAPD